MTVLVSRQFPVFVFSRVEFFIRNDLFTSKSCFTSPSVVKKSLVRSFPHGWFGAAVRHGVPRRWHRFSFNSTIHFWCITFGVIRYTTLPSRPSYWRFTFGALHSPWCTTIFYHVGTPGLIPPLGILLCVGPHLLLLPGFLRIRGV